jgi:hypothetical protein
VLKDTLDELQTRVRVATQGVPVAARKLDDVRKRMANLDELMAAGALSAGAVQKLSALCAAVKVGDTRTALEHHNRLVAAEFEGNATWLMGLKTLLSMVAQPK